MQFIQYRGWNIVYVTCDLKVGIMFPKGFRDYSPLHSGLWILD
jgi:hypothetical protein